MAKLAIVLFMLLLLGCEEKQQEPECDAICEIHKAHFENTTTGIVYRSGYSPGKTEYVSVTKTATGVIAKYKPWNNLNMKPLEVELGIEEWQDFIRALYKCRIDEWEKHSSTNSTFLEIYSSDKNNPYIKIPFSGRDHKEEFHKIMHDMEVKIKERAGDKDR